MSDVFFTSAESDSTVSRLQKFERLIERSGLAGLIAKGDKVAIKTHFGEHGNTAFLRVPYLRAVVAAVRAAGGVPFVTDTTTLYTGGRFHAIAHLETARNNGFTYETCGAPLIIADGLKGLDDHEVPTSGEPLKSASLASAIVQADALVALIHCKGHLLYGYGGALKHLAMGCASAAGKQVLHSDVRPRVDQESCTGCGVCVASCLHNAITLGDVDGDSKASISAKACVGCGECVVACPERAIPINWNTSAEPLYRKTSQYAGAVLNGKQGKFMAFGAAIDVTRDCDCCNWHVSPFVPDLGFFASSDPVALDCAAREAICAAPLTPGHEDLASGDRFAHLCDNDYRQLFALAESYGVGTRAYRLVTVS
jgi:uncharacterized protein